MSLLAPALCLGPQCLAQDSGSVGSVGKGSVLAKRASAVALTRRGTDEVGDAHERSLLRFELARLKDRLGDLEEIRLRRAFLNGRKATLGARLARAVDTQSDAKQLDLARRTRLRRYAATARLRDFSGDKKELLTWRRDYVRHGPAHTGAIKIAKQRQDREAQRRAEREEEQRLNSRHEQKQSRAEEQEERDIWRGEDRLDRSAERDLEEDAEDEGDRDAEREEREEERELDSEAEKAIQQAEEGDPEP